MPADLMPRVGGEILKREFGEIFREHYQLVYRTAYTVTGNRQDAEDVLQTIFLRLLRRRSSFDLTVSPKKYLYRAAVNESLNIVRTRKKYELVDDVGDEDVLTRGSRPNADEEIQQRLVSAIAQLSPQVVEILILRYEHDYSDAEIAKMLGKSRGVIAVTLFRARARLRRLIRTLSGDK